MDVAERVVVGTRGVVVLYYVGRGEVEVAVDLEIAALRDDPRYLGDVEPVHGEVGVDRVDLR